MNKNLDEKILAKLNSKITSLTLNSLLELRGVFPTLETKRKKMIWNEIKCLEETYGNFDDFVSYLHVHHVQRKRLKSK